MLEKFDPLIWHSPTRARQRYVPHKTLREGWTYVPVPDDDMVIGIRVAVTKVMKVLNPDDTPVVDSAGNPSYFMQSVNIVKILTDTEFDIVKKMELGGE